MFPAAVGWSAGIHYWSCAVMEKEKPVPPTLPIPKCMQSQKQGKTNNAVYERKGSIQKYGRAKREAIEHRPNIHSIATDTTEENYKKLNTLQRQNLRVKRAIKNNKWFNKQYSKVFCDK